MKNYKKIILLSSIFLFVAFPVLAKSLLGPNGYVPCATNANQVLSLNCFLLLLGGVSKLILGLTGSLALLYFVYGGIRLLLSRGNETAITEGKNILSHAIIGVIIILGAYLIVTSLEKIVGFKPTGNFELNTNTVLLNTPKKVIPKETIECICKIRELLPNNKGFNDYPITLKTYTTLSTCEAECDDAFCRNSQKQKLTILGAKCEKKEK